MTSAEERIKELARKSAIDPKVAAEMLGAVRPAPVAPPASWDPFERISSERAVLAGVLASGAFFLMSFAGLRTNGTFDLQASQTPVSPLTAAIDQLLAYPVHALLLWLVAKPLARATRFIDILAAVGVARVPAAVLALPLAVLHHFYGEPSGPLLGVALALVTIALGLEVALVVMGFRTATGLRGPKLALTVVGAFVVAETVIKITLHLIDR